MSDLQATTTADPIPWPAELAVRIRDGYGCRRCRAAVIADDERRVVRILDADEIEHDADPDATSNMRLLCLRCAREHQEAADVRRRARRWHERPLPRLPEYGHPGASGTAHPGHPPG